MKRKENKNKIKETLKPIRTQRNESIELIWNKLLNWNWNGKLKLSKTRWERLKIGENWLVRIFWRSLTATGKFWKHLKSLKEIRTEDNMIRIGRISERRISERLRIDLRLRLRLRLRLILRWSSRLLE